MSASRPRGIELRRPWGSRTSTLVCTHGHATEVPTEGAPTTCPVCDLVSADEAQAILDVCDMVATLPTSAAQVLPREGRTLLDMVPDLARTVVALHGQLDALRAIIEGRTTAPTDAEIDAHWRARGAWLYSDGHGCVFGTAHDLYTARWCRDNGHAVRWWPLREGRPCAWPVADTRKVTP